MLQGYFQISTVPSGTSPISGAPPFPTSAPSSLWKSPNIQRDNHGRLMVGYAWSASYWRGGYSSHLCIRQDPLDQVFECPAYLSTVSDDWQYSKRYPLHTCNAHLDSRWADSRSPERWQDSRGDVGVCGWICAGRTPESWHNRPRLKMELCWWIPELMLPSFGCLGWVSSRTGHGCWTLMWLLPDVWLS